MESAIDKFNNLFLKGQFRDALNIANQELFKEKSATWFMYKAQCCYCLGDYEKALTYINKAEEDTPVSIDFDYNYWRSMVYNGMNEFEKALECIEKSIKVSPTLDKYRNKAAIYVEQGDYENAINLYEQINNTYEQDKITPLDWFYLASSYYQLDELQKALSAINKCVLMSQDTSYCYTKSLILRKLGRLEDAEIWLKKSEEN